MRVLFLLFISISSFGQATFHSLIAEDIIQSNLVIDTESITYGLEFKFQPNTPNNDLYQPSILYDSGNVYMPASLGMLNYFARPMIIPYYYNLGFDYPIPVGRGITTSDAHARQAAAVAGDTLFTVVEHPHNTPLYIFKSQFPNDIYSFTRTIGNEIGTSQSYPQIHYLGDNINSDSAWFVLGQVDDSFPGGNWGDATFTEWSNDTEIAEMGGSVDDRYVSTPNQSLQYASGWRYFVLNFRPNERWKQRYLIKTRDFKCFYNFDESFSVCDTIFDTDVDPFLVFDPGSDAADNGYQSSAVIDTHENFYTVAYHPDSADFVFIYQIAGTSTPHVKALGLTNYVYGTDLGITDGGQLVSQLGAVDMVIAKDSTDISIFVRQRLNAGDSIRFHQYRTVNLGDSWIYMGDVFNEVPDTVNFFRCRTVSNTADVPFNTNFPILASALVETVEEETSIYVKRAAFNSISNESDSLFSLPAYTYDEYNALTERSYYSFDSTMTRSGANVTALIDQSPNSLNTSVPVSSPQYNTSSGEYVSFNGSGQFMILTTFADIAALTQGTVIAVARKTTTVNSRAFFLCAADIGVAHRKLAFGINTAGTNQSIMCENNPINQLSNNFRTFGSDTVDYAEWTIYMWQFSDGVCSQQFVNGKKQVYNWEIASLAWDQMNRTGVFFSGVGTDRISLGRLSTNVNEDFDFDLKHLSIVDHPMTFEEMRKTMRYLSELYNIPLNDDHFR